VSAGWREGTLTRAKELESLCAWVLANDPRANCDVLARSIGRHLEAARQAAERTAQAGQRRILRNGPLMERAMSNLDAAEAQLLNLASADYLLGQMPSLLRNVQCHLIRADPRRQEIERISRELGVSDPHHRALQQDPVDKRKKVEEERGKIVTATRAASSAALREQLRIRSFRNVLVVTTLLMAMLAIGVALIGFLNPSLIPLCFAPQESGQTVVVVCPTAQSQPIGVGTSGRATNPSGSAIKGIDDAIRRTAAPQDLFVVELVGMIAAVVAAAAAIRGIRGSSERYGLPVALAALKLPTGAITAFLGLLLMRGQFVPGLSALDTSAQILAWALVFGYAQQLLTRLVDRQGQTVLDSVRGASKPQQDPSSS